MPERWELKQMQSLPLELKIIKTQLRVREWYDYWNGNVYISYSGGKDSSVLRHIVRDMYSDVPSVFVDTGLEYPEVRNCAKKYADIILRPKMRFDEVIKKYGYPVISKEQSAFISEVRHSKSQKLIQTRLNGNKYGRGKISKKWVFLIDSPFEISDKCCDIMKKAPLKDYETKTNNMPMIATMTNESAQRQSNWLMYGCNAFDAKRPTSKPMSFWKEQDILQYIKQYNIEIPSVYGDIKEENGCLYCTGVQRTGCMFCMFGAHLEKEPNRFQQMKVTHPKQYEYCMKPIEEGGLGLNNVLNYVGVTH